MALLVQGGIYADSDTAPIVHPYLWGIDAHDILDPDLHALTPYLERAKYDTTLRHEDDLSSLPPSVRSNVPWQTSALHSIVDPGISMVVALEWDQRIAFDPTRWYQWKKYRMERAFRDCCYARRLQILQYLMVVGRFGQ
jgi:alpha 1,6-mannosyltransferase